MSLRSKKWRVVLRRSGELVGHVVAPEYYEALGAGIALAARSKHTPQPIEVIEELSRKGLS